MDSDGEMLYGVKYSDNDYEELTFLQAIRVLQPYDPLNDEDDTLEVTPFFGSSTQQTALTDADMSVNDKQEKSVSAKQTPPRHQIPTVTPGPSKDVRRSGADLFAPKSFDANTMSAKMTATLSISHHQ